MDHPTHKLNAYCENRRRIVFCELCGKEDDEGLNDPCNKTFYTEKVVDTTIQAKYPKFVSGLP